MPSADGCEQGLGLALGQFSGPYIFSGPCQDTLRAFFIAPLQVNTGHRHLNQALDPGLEGGGEVAAPEIFEAFVGLKKSPLVEFCQALLPACELVGTQLRDGP